MTGWRTGFKKSSVYRDTAPTERAAACKSAALQNLFIAESKKLYLQWKAEGMTFEMFLAKVKDYARSLKLDGDANKGKQAVDLNRVQNWADEKATPTEEQAEEGEEGLNRVNLKWYFCGKKRAMLLPSAVNFKS